MVRTKCTIMIVLDLRRARNKEEYEFLCNVAVDISLRALLDPSDSQASVTDSQPFSRLTDGHQLFKPSSSCNAKQATLFTQLSCQLWHLATKNFRSRNSREICIYNGTIFQCSSVLLFYLQVMSEKYDPEYNPVGCRMYSMYI